MRGGQWSYLHGQKGPHPCLSSALALLALDSSRGSLLLYSKATSHKRCPLLQCSLQIFSVEEVKGWFWDWGPGLAFRTCSAAAPLHSVKYAVYSLSFLCPSALAQGVENEKSAVETLGLLHWVTVSRYTCDVTMSMDMLVEGERVTNRVEALPLLMLHVCF